MSMISEIAKETLSTLTKSSKSFTPDNYMEVFCKIARSKGVLVEDCNKLDKYLSKLDDSLKKEIKSYNVKNVDDLFVYITTKLNRSKPSQTHKQISLFLMLLKRVMQITAESNDKKVAELSRSSIERLGKFQDINTLELLKNRWFDLLVTPKSEDRSKYDDIKFDADIGDIIATALIPSIASSVNDKIAKLSLILKKDIDVLNTKNGKLDFKDAVKTRIDLDKKEVANKISSIDKILSEISKRIVEIIDKSSESSEEVNAIKKEIESMDFSKDNLETIQRKLIKLASSLELETITFTKKLEHSNKKVEDLKTRVSLLEKELKDAKKEIREDSLTEVATRKHLDESMDRMEHSFLRNGINYSIVFIDIDHFKKINDKYGHDAGDTVLRTLGRVLKKYTRDIDIVGRYGGEEFLVLLQKNSLQEAAAFANKLRVIVSNFKFLYKGDRIHVSFSAGTASRDECDSLKETKIKADKRLYEAKNSGRDRVKPDI